MRMRKKEKELCTGLGLSVSCKTRNKEFSWFPLALINFLTVFGSLGGFLSAFAISYSIIPVGIVFFGAACFFSLIYRYRITKNIGYVVFFVFFFYQTLRNRIMINSGFYHILNRVYEVFSEYFNLSGYKTYQEQNTNAGLTVTSCILFLGIVEILFFNMVLVERRSFLGTLFFGLPILFVPMYVHKEPSLFYLLCLTGAVLFSAVIKWNPGNQKSRAYRQAAEVLFACLLLLTPILSLFYPKQKYDEGMIIDSKMKKATMETVSYLAAFGISGFFDSYASTGGISGGKLGGVYSVRPDYQTDLVVTFVPYSYSSLYLKAYMGNDYTGDAWENTLQKPQNGSKSLLETGTEKESRFLEERYKKGEENAAIAKILIQNEDAEMNYAYLPYYTKNSTRSSFFLRGQEKSILFYPFLDTTIDGDFSLSKDEKSENLKVPDHLKPLLEMTCREAGLERGMDTIEAAKTMYQYFLQNFEYSMQPGRTPRDKDFVEYFLTKQKKGYCAHFASAAVLLFRTIGIPARYIEGYSLGYYDLENAELTEYDISEFYQGKNLLEDTGVVKAEINDSMAHAWVEVFDEKRGWQVVEETIPSRETEEETFQFWKLLSGFFSADSSELEKNNAKSADTEKTWNLNDIRGLTKILVFGILLLLLWCLFCFVLGSLRRNRAFYHHGISMGIKSVYLELKKLAEETDGTFPSKGRMIQQAEYFYKNTSPESEFAFSESEFADKMLKSFYAKEPLSQEDGKELFQILMQLRKQILSQMKILQKIKYYLGVF